MKIEEAREHVHAIWPMDVNVFVGERVTSVPLVDLGLHPPPGIHYGAAAYVPPWLYHLCVTARKPVELSVVETLQGNLTRVSISRLPGLTVSYSRDTHGYGGRVARISRFVPVGRVASELAGRSVWGGPIPRKWVLIPDKLVTQLINPWARFGISGFSGIYLTPTPNPGFGFIAYTDEWTLPIFELVVSNRISDSTAVDLLIECRGDKDFRRMFRTINWCAPRGSIDKDIREFIKAERRARKIKEHFPNGVSIDDI